MSASLHVVHLSPADEVGEILNQLGTLESEGLNYVAASSRGLDGTSLIELTLKLGTAAGPLALAITKIIMAWLAASSKRSVTIDGKKITITGYAEQDVVRILSATQENIPKRLQ